MTGVARFIPNYDGIRINWDNRSVRSAHVSFGQVRYRPGGYCGPRVQQDYELVVLHSGSCEVRVEQGRRTLSVGQVGLFRPGHRELFRFSRRRPTHHSWCSVRPAFLPPAFRGALNRAPAAISCTELFDRILATAFLTGEARHPTAARVVDQLGLALLAEYLDAARRAEGGGCGSECVQRALRYMEEHFDQDDCLAGAQRAAGCCRNALIYKFSRAAGATPARHLWQLRTEKGLAMLSETGLTVSEIAFKCGFRNPYHFSRKVRQHQGCPPREVRRRAWV